MESLAVALVGPTGIVGQEFLKLLQRRYFPIKELRLLGSGSAVGRRALAGKGEIEIRELSTQNLRGIDLALFAGGAEAASSFAPVAVRQGALVIDTSAAFRLNPNVPMIVPEINPDDARHHRGIIASPNPMVVQLALTVAPLHKQNGLKRIVIDTYQCVAGNGGSAMEELTAQSKTVIEGRTPVPHLYPHQIAFNVLPEIDVFMDNGYSREEWVIINELRRVLHLPELPVSVTAVRVPVYLGNSAAIHVELATRLGLEDARSLLAGSPAVRLQDDPGVSMYPHPWAVVGQDEVYVGRVREDMSASRCLSLWCAADNIRRGAALNALLIAQLLLQRGWMRCN